MKRTYLVTLGLIGLIVLGTQPQFAAVIIEFMFLGMIPGTTLTLPFWVIGSFYLVVITAGLVWISNQPLYIGDQPHQDKVARALARQKIARQIARQEPAIQRAQYSTQATETNA